MDTSLLVHPNRAVLAVLIPGGIEVTRLVVGMGVHVTQVVTGLTRLTVHADVYGDVLVVRQTFYPTFIDGGIFVRVSGCVCCVYWCLVVPFI